MAVNFPSSPVPGQVYTSGGASWTWDGTKWVSTPLTESSYLSTAGGTMTGLIKSYDSADDWLAAEIDWAARDTTNIYALSYNGMASVCFGSQNLSNTDDTRVPLTIGVISYAFNNNGLWGGASSTWAGYFEARSYPGILSYTMGLEIDIVNLTGADAGVCTPYGEYPNPVSIAINMASGGGAAEYEPDLSSKAASIGLWVVNNGARYQTGILFRDNALVGTDGLGTGIGRAIGLGAGHALQWYQPGGALGPKIYSQQVVNPPVDLAFGDGLATFNDAATTTPLLGVQSGYPALDETAMLVLINRTAGVTYARVSIGAADSGGSGFRMLRVPN